MYIMYLYLVNRSIQFKDFQYKEGVVLRAFLAEYGLVITTIIIVAVLIVLGGYMVGTTANTTDGTLKTLKENMDTNIQSKETEYKDVKFFD